MPVRRQTWLTGGLAAPMLAAAVLATACGASGSAAGSGSGRGTSYQQAAAYAQCMRSHGAPSWPDPNSQGSFLMTPANAADFHAPASAQLACAHLLPRGGRQAGSAATPKQLANLLKYAACMRTHGVPGFPDPLAGGGFSMAGANVNVSSPQFTAAQQICQKIAPW